MAKIVQKWLECRVHTEKKHIIVCDVEVGHDMEKPKSSVQFKETEQYDQN